MSKIPIIVCGRTPVIGSSVRKIVWPDYDVVHFCLDPAKAVTEIPLILSGGTPPDHNHNLGSQNYSQPPIAVALGGGYNNEQFQAIKKAAEESSTAKKVVWLRADMSKLGRPPMPNEFETYATQVGERLKIWLSNENSEEKNGGEFFF